MLRRVVERGVEHCEHPLLIETAVGEVDLVPVTEAELSRALRRLGRDGSVFQTVQVVVAQRRIDHVERAIAALEAVLHERQQHTVRLVPAVEERADVAVLAELRASNS